MSPDACLRFHAFSLLVQVTGLFKLQKGGEAEGQKVRIGQSKADTCHWVQEHSSDT